MPRPVGTPAAASASPSASPSSSSSSSASPSPSPSPSPSQKKRQKRPGSLIRQARSSKTSRRSLNSSDIAINNVFNDSGSDCDSHENVNFANMRRVTRRLRDYIVKEDVDEEVPVLQNAEWGEQEKETRNQSVKDEKMNSANVVSESNENERGRGARKAQKSTADESVDINFSWSQDFSSFTGQKESYLRIGGPAFPSQDPAEIFRKIWDDEFMEMVVTETNLYAWDIISKYHDPIKGTKNIPGYLVSWIEVTVEEMYRYFAILILMSFCQRSQISEYWDTGILGMPVFRSIMSRHRFSLINKFLHFVSNVDLLANGYDRKIEKIAPVLNHCNRKFARMYTPSQHLSLDESLLLWKGILSFKQCIRTKTARFGVKSFELCEAETGYLLQYRLYAGKHVEMHSEPLHRFQNHTAKIVLDLMEGYLDVGHVLVMDNWYNQLALTRYLKTRRTDVLGTLNRRRNGIPSLIKDFAPNKTDRGAIVGTHCGDIALVAWNDVKLVTLISTYHKHVMVAARRSGQEFLKPVAVEEYNRYMGGVDLKDQKLSMFLMERKGNLKWYMKVFRRLLNTSLLNAFIIYSKNPMHRVYSHRQFRMKVIEGLLTRYPPLPSVARSVPPDPTLKPPRLRPGYHFPAFTEVVKAKGKRRQLRCVRCTALKLRTVVTMKCALCQVPLCIEPCWLEYHTVLNLKKIKKIVLK